MLTLITGGSVHSPDALGTQDVLLLDGRIAKVGAIDRRALERCGLDLAVIEATGHLVTPGFIDPHEHLLGGSGESGFSSQTPEIVLSEIVAGGITTVVGTLGVDTSMKTMAGLLARVKGLNEEGINAFLWTGGYNVPPSTITSSIRNDLMFIAEVVGAGEVAIADHRGLCPQAPELAKLVLDTHVGGMLSRKSGVTHFHVGEDDQRLKRLRELLEGDFAVAPDMLYPTHIGRSEALMDEAIALVHEGAWADIDVADGSLGKWASYWFDHDGDPGRLTLSSDAGESHPARLLEEWRDAILEHGCPLERMLPLITSNTAAVLKLQGKGRIAPGCDADLVVLERESLEIVHVIARGQCLVQDGRLVRKERFLEDSSRTIALEGKSPA